MFEQKLIEAKEKRRELFIKSVIAVVAILLIATAIVAFISFNKSDSDETEIVLADDTNQIEEDIPIITPIQTPSVPNAELRQTYIDALNDYQNNIKPELGKIDLLNWDKPRTERLVMLEDKALSQFSVADYDGALRTIEEVKQLAQSMLADSQLEFETSLSNAQNAYEQDNYEDAKFHIANALMLNRESVDASTLATKIDELPKITTLLEKANTARVENKPETELKLIKEIIQLVPERQSAIERKSALINIINNKNFKSAIDKSYQAIEQGNVELAKQKIGLAKKIYPKRPEIADLTIALQQFEKKQRFNSNLQAAQKAILADDWPRAEKQLTLALKEHSDNQAVQTLLLKTTTIIALQNAFDQQLNKPYRLSNEQLASKVKSKIVEAEAFANDSPSLHQKANELSQLLEKMGQKISVEITSDNQTSILVRGVGVVGVTELKTIQLSPGYYKFEGKRKGYKSKLIDVLIPYDQSSYQINIYCDEPI